MNQGRTVFSQWIAFLPDREFRHCVARYEGDARLRDFSCWDQYLTMAFAQLTYRESLRDIEACLRALGTKLYHMGFQGKVARSTLADANESRDWRIFADFAHVLIRIARPLCATDPIGVDLDQSLYALDSTTIDLCLSLFPWAKFRKHKAAVKMHTRLDLHGNIPTFIRVTDGIEPVGRWALARGKAVNQIGLEIAYALASLVRRILEEQPPAGLIVAGGETAGAVCRTLELGALEVGANIEPGVPLCVSLGRFRLPVVLKSGNFGSEDFYGRARAACEVLSCGSCQPGHTGAGGWKIVR
jgi:hypothetical protein